MTLTFTSSHDAVSTGVLVVEDGRKIEKHSVRAISANDSELLAELLKMANIQ